MVKASGDSANLPKLLTVKQVYSGRPVMCMERTFHEIMGSLKGELRSIFGLIPSGASIAYMDYPVYGNIGDLLIMTATEQFFTDYGLKLVYRANVSYFDVFNVEVRSPKPFPPIDKSVVIVCQGGGNFGDLYPGLQAFRERVVQCFPENRIIFLPQTIYFRNRDNLHKSASVLKRHQDLHIFARDRQSFSVAIKNFFNHLYLAPDMAHQLWPSLYGQFKKNETKETLFLIRRDIEQSPVSPQFLTYTKDFVDWPDLLKPYDKLFIYLMGIAHRINTLLRNIVPLDRIWFQYAENLVGRSVRLVAPYRTIVTSRLHGHILACLLMKNNITLDNSYGKNSAYYYSWTHRLSPYCLLHDSNPGRYAAEAKD